MKYLKKKNRFGFTLFEFMLSIMVLFIIIVVATPLLLYAIKTFRINAFKSSAQNVLDSVKYYIADNEFVEIPKEGISIRDLDLEVKNNNFDDGVIVQIDDGNFEIVYLKKENYCAKGNPNNLRATDEGCGALDVTNPTKAYVFFKNSTTNEITVVAEGVDDDSEIVGYEFKIDNENYTKVSNSNVYTFKKVKPGKHEIMVRVTNEAGLTTTSDVYTFETNNINRIKCYQTNDDNFSTKKEIECIYPFNRNYKYQISEDAKEWIDIELVNNKYNIEIEQNKNIYSRVLEEDNVISSTVIKINNIDSILNGSLPELEDGLILVKYDENKDAWVKASNQKIEWDYENKKWANTVLVKKYADEKDVNSHSRKYYMSEDATYNPIYEKDILGFFVWIPRFKYQLFNNYGKSILENEINIIFENKEIEKSLGTTNSSWLTHKAFSYNGEQNGFWVSKFQNSTLEDSNCYSEASEENCNKTGLNLYSLPNKKSISNLSISTASILAKEMNITNNIYGLNNLNSNVLTNLEWGAITYLSNSKFGANKKITTNYQNYKNNLDNSTTNNITGVFDMVGEKQEFVMSNYNHDAGKNRNDHSGFKYYGNVEWPDIIDYYSGITVKNRLLGDATGETEKWYNGNNIFVNGEYPFFIRGKDSIFSFDHASGSADSNTSFRVTLRKN